MKSLSKLKLTPENSAKASLMVFNPSQEENGNLEEEEGEIFNNSISNNYRKKKSVSHRALKIKEARAMAILEAEENFYKEKLEPEEKEKFEAEKKAKEEAKIHTVWF